MVKARSRAQLSIALGLSELEMGDIPVSNPRPLSAPTTRVESGQAQKSVSSSDPIGSENEALRIPSGGQYIYRPASCLPIRSKH